MTGILRIATSGLMAFQRSLATTGHNIANVNTEGFSRQRVDLVESDPQFTATGFLGNGVEIATVKRIYDKFLDNQIRTSLSAHAELDAYHRMASQVDDIVADQDASLSPSLQAFFNAVQGVANDPTSIAARRVMLTEGENLARRFNTLNDRMDALREQVNQTLSGSVEDINTLASGIAAFNQRVVAALGQSAGKHPPNDLLDQRNLLLEKLSKQIDTQVVEHDDGALTVLVGNGQTLVMGNKAFGLELQSSTFDPQAKEIAISSPGSGRVIITNNIQGGEIKGLLDFGSQVLDSAQNALGRIAIGLSSQFNAQHESGYGLDGSQGSANPFFNTVPMTVKGRAGNSGVITATLADANQLTADDYRIEITATGATVTNLRTRASATYTNSAFSHEGISFNLSPPPPAVSPAAGDSFLVQPTRNAAGNLSVALTDPRKIAASASDPLTGTVGDNENARALVALQTSQGLLGGTASYQDAYNEIVGEVGTWTKAAEVNSTAQKNLLDHATQQRDSVSGVNLDEEAANLIKFQQSYQAAAQLISTANNTFQALIGAVGG